MKGTVKGVSLKGTMHKTVKCQHVFAMQAITTLEGILSFNVPNLEF